MKNIKVKFVSLLEEAHFILKDLASASSYAIHR